MTEFAKIEEIIQDRGHMTRTELENALTQFDNEDMLKTISVLALSKSTVDTLQGRPREAMQHLTVHERAEKLLAKSSKPKKKEE